MNKTKLGHYRNLDAASVSDRRSYVAHNEGFASFDGGGPSRQPGSQALLHLPQKMAGTRFHRTEASN